MEKTIKYKYFKNEYEERVSNKLFKRFLIALFIFYILLIVCFQTFFTNFTYVTILGQSMQPTLNKNPVFVDFQDYETKQFISDGVYVKYTHDVDYNDIVIIDNRGIKDTIIKRTLGLAGDYVSIAKVANEMGGSEYRFMRRKKNSATVEILYENYIRDYEEWSLDPEFEAENGVVYDREFYKTFMVYNQYEYQTFKVSLDGGKTQSDVIFFKVPENQIYYMGDNRAHSTDSRDDGTISTEKIVGKVVEIVPRGTKFKGNGTWWWNRVVGFINVVWKEILRFFGANVSL